MNSDELSGLIFLACRSAAESAEWQPVCEAMARHLDAERCGLVRYDPRSRQAQLLAGWGYGADGAAGNEAAARWENGDTGLSHGTGPDGKALLWALVGESEAGRVVFELARRPGEPAFEPAAGAAVLHLLPLLRLGLSHQAAIIRLQTLWQAAIEVLEQLPMGVILLDAAAMPLAINGYAKAVAAAQDGLAFGRDGIVAASAQDSRTLKRLVREAAGETGQPVQALQLPRPSGLRPLSVLVLPLAAARLSTLGERAPAAVLYVADPERPIPVNQQRLCRLYDLTPTEARLASFLACGETLEEAAHQMSIGLSTVRTHLKRIFAKTGVERQAELVHLLLTGLVRIQQH